MHPEINVGRKAGLLGAWRVQTRVVHALMLRELHTRFGRENIGFLWIMVEPLLFAGLVSIMWRLVKGPEEHGVGIVAFVVTGYIPITLFRHAVSRSISIFVANGSLLYHQQIKILDFIVVRFVLEMLGGMMAFAFIVPVLIYFEAFPVPSDMGMFILGWLIYSLVTLSICLVIAPLSEMSEVVEKLVPVTTYIMIPFSGAFSMASWLSPSVRDYMLLSPFVDAMELMRGGIWGDELTVYYNLSVPLVFSMICTLLGLALCRRVRRHMAVE